MWRHLRTLVAVLVLVLAATPSAPASADPGISDDPILTPGYLGVDLEKLRLDEAARFERDLAFITRRTAGDVRLSEDDAGRARANAEQQGENVGRQGGPTAGPNTFSGAWTGVGPNPIMQVTRTDGALAAMSGRIGALAIRPSNHQFILGAAQGGIWLYDAATKMWSPKSDNAASLAIGALAIAPSNDAIVYAGTGEGALSGDSYTGNGILKSIDGGNSWSHVSDDYFQSVSVSRLVVDPTNADHLYATVLRGRGGARRTSQLDHSRFGIWESKDGAESWKLIKASGVNSLGATDIEIDPITPKTLYASIEAEAIYKSTDAGKTWATIMNGLPPTTGAPATTANYAAGVRFSIALSHPAGASPVLYVGFDWTDMNGAHHNAHVWKSTDAGANWIRRSDGTGEDSIFAYCGTQCSYDNVVEADPANPNIVYVAGSFNYGIGSGGIYRSSDGGATWKNLGFDQHPDFHALAFDTTNPAHILIGSDGGVWYSPSRGGRLNAGDPLDAVDWVDLNGGGLAIAQFTSIATVPQVPARLWGGTQDNGTLRKSGASNRWFDMTSGDGGQVLVDPTFDAANASCALPFAPSCYVYGTYFDISPYRMTDGGAGFFTNRSIARGINVGDRSDFYVPFVMNKSNTNQLFLGSYRLYRTDNARAASAGEVTWKPISGDLTSGCTGRAPNGARNCTLSAIGVGGGRAVYTGSLDGLVYLSTDAQVNDTTTWTRIDKPASGGGENQGDDNQGDDGQSFALPSRPVTQIAVDASNYQIAYVAYAGFNSATPSRPGHVFKTTNAGRSWRDLTGNLPDSPVNSIIIDPSFADTLYAGTDVGAFVTHDGGDNWRKMGTGFPTVAIWQLDLDPSHRTMAAGTHGRGAFRLSDTFAVPALVLSKTDTGRPVGPGISINYTITLKNIGNAPATGVTITDPIPSNTSFVSADMGGTNNRGTVTWSGFTIPAGGSFTAHLTVKIDSNLSSRVMSITNTGMRATSAQGPMTTGSPFVTPIAPAHAVTIAPATQLDGGKVGTAVPYSITLTNRGYKSDSYTLSASPSATAHFFDASCTTALTTTAPVAPGDSTTVCVKIDVPSTAANGSISTTTITATSVGGPTASASATIKTIAVAVKTLLVDNDDNNPNVQATYTAALNAAGEPFSTWDLATNSNLPLNYLKAFKNVVWFTGNTYPGPILPYETRLKAYLDNGGRLFINGQDLLDQAAGTTAFVSGYLHVSWDGSEAQNDKATVNVHPVGGSPLVTGLATVALDHGVLGANFEDQITPTAGAFAAFTDDAGKFDGLTFSGTYKVAFLAFPFEAYGTAADKTQLMKNVLTFFGP